MESITTPLATRMEPTDVVTIIHTGHFVYQTQGNELKGFPQWVVAMDRIDGPIKEFFNNVEPPKLVRVVVTLEIYDAQSS